MKKLNFLFFSFFFAINNYSQITPGIYQIKLFANQRVLENYSESQTSDLRFNPSCENPVATNCKKQLWEIKSVPNRTNVFTLTNKANNLMLSYSLTNEGRDVSTNIRLLPPVPQSQRELQFFYIQKEEAAGGPSSYAIMPYKTENTTNRTYFYVSARKSSMNWDNCPLEIDYREEKLIDAKENVQNVLFTFTPVTNTVNIGPSRVLSNVVQSPPVLVLPKSNNKIEVDITTGSDNLEPKSTQHGAEIRIILKNRPDVIKTNINEGKEWPNGSTRRIELPLPTDITENDIKELHLYRKRDGLQYVWQLGEKDNWNVNRVKVNAIIFKNGVKNNIPMLDTGAERPRIPGNNSLTRPLFRFVYEGGDGVNEGQFFKLLLDPMSQGRMHSGTSNATVKVTFGTGGDNLEGGNGNNVDVTIRFKSNNQPIIIRNINQTKKLNNFTEETFTKELTNSQNIELNDVKEVEIRHTGGGGMFADNWHVDKIYIVMNINGINRVLVDKVGTPIHMFTGDTRLKKFQVD